MKETWKKNARDKLNVQDILTVTKARLGSTDEKDKQRMKLQSKGPTLLLFFWWWRVKFPSLADQDGGPLMGNIYIIYIHIMWISLVAGLRHTILAAADPGSLLCPVTSHTDTQTQTHLSVDPRIPQSLAAVQKSPGPAASAFEKNNLLWETHTLTPGHLPHYLDSLARCLVAISHWHPSPHALQLLQNRNMDT